MRRSWKSGWLLAIAVCALPVLTPRPARAQTASEIAQAQDWFKDALSLEQASKWQDALTELRRVAAVKLTPQIGFHLGLCESHVGLLVEARVDLERARDGARAQGLTKVVDAASGSSRASNRASRT